GGVMFAEVGKEVGGCDLILNCGQMDESSVHAPDLTNNIWKFEFENEFKSITLTHSVGENPTYTNNGDGTHGFACSVCGAVVDNEVHTLTYTANGSTITASCSKCNANLGTAAISASDKTYDGSALEAAVTKTGSLENATTTITYAVKDGAVLNGAPVNSGTYTASITLGEGANAATASAEFTIQKKELTPTVSGTVSKPYDGTTDVPENNVLSITLDGKVENDDVTATASYAYDAADAGTTKINATNITLGGADAGNYVLKDTTASANVGTITKAVPAYTVPTGLTAANGQVLSAIALPTGWAWANDTLTVGISGGTYQAIFTPADAVNYQTVNDIAVTVGHGHSYEAAWSNDETNHWHECACGDKKDTAVHTDEGKDHKCDVCQYTIGTCEDADLDHACDYGCDEYYGTHEDADKNHACDYGCTVAIGECVDNDKDHDCDYGCDEYYGTHADADKNHACDYGCAEAIGTCEDKDLDHDCDYGCDEYYGTHEDSSEDADHVCDYGCGAVLEACADADSNHNCDVCGAVLSECVDTTPQDYKCDICCKELPRPSYGGYIPTTPSVSDKVEITVPDTLGDDVNVEAENITTATLNDVKDIVSDNDNLALIGGKDSAVQITAKEDNKPLERFEEPVSVTVPVSKNDMKDIADIGSLTLALVTEDETGNTKLTYVGGSYDAENGTFTAYTNMPGNYVLVEKADLMEIVLTIDSTIAHVNDKSVEKDVPSRIVGSRTLVPAAFVLHHMGCGVEWIGDTRTVVVTLPSGEKLFMPVDTPIPGFGTQPIIENGRTLVPVAYVADMMDAYVLWVGDERKVIIVK
ncbi:MAG: hypothetical protein J6A10_00360, partial [Peptococcaceae bacterium]|nr:hypothetical protein [Peptococcaceae bacterium]